MSIHFGILYPEGQRAATSELESIASATSRYAEDGCEVRICGRVGMGFQPFHTDSRSVLGTQPLVTGSGEMLTLDGRIDSYRDLCGILDLDAARTSDAQLIQAAFQKWGVDCFSRFIGDWALALWSETERTLYLARDHAGMRTLYYSAQKGQVRWGTYVESLLAPHPNLVLDRNYAARYLSALPIRDATPYQGIVAVTPAHCLAFHEGEMKSFAHWTPQSRRSICYDSDSEYQQHFFSLFRQSVERRSGGGRPILAQLSGGMDSSSIVCMSDMIRKEHGEAELLDTVSFYDDEEETWNERPYFTAVEEFRGKTGIHLRASFRDRDYRPLSPDAGRYFFPGGDASSWLREQAFLDQLGETGHRVILSGVGGDELTGGVPTAFPELASALASWNIVRFMTRAYEWSRAERTPVLWRIADTLREIWRLYRGPAAASLEAPAWLTADARRWVEDIRSTCDPLTKASFAERPDSVLNRRCLWSILEGLPHRSPALLRRFEYRCPYLDRDLIEFLFSVPRAQLVRPDERRSLMRRSLAHVLPQKVLERRKKAFVAHSPVQSLVANLQHLNSLLKDARTAQHGLVDPTQFSRALDALAEGRDIENWPLMLRVVLFEVWLRSGAFDHPSAPRPVSLPSIATASGP